MEIGVADLALDEQEAARLAALGGRELPPHEARDLHVRTEGWPAAVYLAARRAPRPRAANGSDASGVSGRDTDIGDYLDAELLDHASPRVRTFLLKTAVLDRMTAGLCDAVVEGTGSGRILRDLASTNQLVVPLDTEGGWFRYHTLLREHLLAMLERDRVSSDALHRRAAAWFAASGMPELAVDHLFAAGDPDAAAAQACAVVPRLFREGREVDVRALARAASTTTASGGSRSSPPWARGCTRSRAGSARRSGWSTSRRARSTATRARPAPRPTRRPSLRCGR